MPLQKDWMNHLDELPIDARLTRTSMTEDDLAIEAIWKCAFPNGLNHDEVLQLIHLMYVVDGEQYPFSFRVLARYIGVLLGVNYMLLLNEVYGVDDIEPDTVVQAKLKDALILCGYYEWLADDGYPVFNEETIDELIPLLRVKRPCKWLTMHREKKANFVSDTDNGTINNFLRATLSLPDTWEGIAWREPATHILWDEMMRILQHDSSRQEIYMNGKEAHVLVGKITKALDDHERTARAFTNYQPNGVYRPVTQSRWQYWIVTMNTSDIGVFGIEE